MKLLNAPQDYGNAVARLKQPDSPLRRTYMAVSLFLVVVTLGFLATIWIYRNSGADVADRGSISAYYYANDTFGFRMRDVFVAAFSMTAILLIVYQGYSRLEDCFLSFAGICLLFVVSCPMDPPVFPAPPPSEEPPLTWRAWVHYISAGLFFVCLIIICVFSNDHIALHDPGLKPFRIGILVTGVLMGLFIPFSVGLYFSGYPFAVYVCECIGVLVFCAYWIIRTLELLHLWRHAVKDEH